MTTLRSPSRTFALLGSVVALGLLGGLGRAGAAIDSTSGAAAHVPAPASVAENAYESDTELRAFGESRAVTLARPLAVDITVAGTYDGTAPLTPGTIPAGTIVDSHLIHADPLGEPDPSTPVTYDGRLTFDGEILGVIILDTHAAPHLRDSDILGAAGTTYPGETGGRGVELTEQLGTDSIAFDDAHTLSLRLVMHRYDQVRVITRSVPAPITTTSTSPSTTTTTLPTTTTTAPAEVLGAVEAQPEVVAELPRTGAPIRPLLIVALVGLGLGGLARRLGTRASGQS